MFSSPEVHQYKPVNAIYRETATVTTHNNAFANIHGSYERLSSVTLIAEDFKIPKVILEGKNILNNLVQLLSIESQLFKSRDFSRSEIELLGSTRRKNPNK